VDWSVSATFPKGTTLEKAVLLGGFDKKWLQKHGRPQIYGKAATDGHWTFVQAGDAPDFYTELAFAWRLVEDSEETAQPTSATDLASHLSALRNRLSVLGEPDLTPSATPETAVQTARGLVELKTTCDRQAVIVLRATPDSPFDGRKIWDVMMSLGLRWGDMDIFHWTNTSDNGDDSFFSVWTSTPPGYFLPEQIAADRVKTADLIFGFSIPRCAAPQSVFSSMVKAAEYTKQRLGGELLNGDRHPLDVAGQQKEISVIEERLKAAGFQPGLQSTLYIF
jgi:cell division protein ZipA